jgi:hypothetical protein
MRLTRLRSHCPDTDSCPALYWTDRDTAVVQGVELTHPEALGARPLAAGEAAVEVPTALMDGLVISGSTLYRTERGTILVIGSVVTDAEALATLHLPPEETAVEICLSLPSSLIKQEVRA